jgi:4-carboxymuconolactone decarboxylase
VHASIEACEQSLEPIEEKTMMSHSARYERGLAKFVEMYGERARTFLASLEGIAPDLGTYVMEFAFGDIHCRPGLSLQTREIATIAALTALGTAAPQLRAHIDGALNVGCSEQEVVEVIMQMALYAGFPAAINGIQAAREVFLERSNQAKKS